MPKSNPLSITHLWCDYYINAAGNPHNYLLNHEHYSQIITGTILTDDNNLPEHIYAFTIKKISEKANNSIFARIKNRLNRYFFWKKVNIWAINTITDTNANVIHAHFGYTTIRFMPLIKKAKLPVIVTFYGVDGSSMLADPKWIPKFKETFNYAAHMVVLSQTVKDRIVTLGYPKEKISLWRIPINLENYIYRTKKQDNAVKFITAARFVEKKGYPFLISAFKKVNDLYPNTSLTIIGYGGGKSKIQQLIDDHSLNNSVSIIDTNLRTDFHEYYYSQLCEHDIFVLPSTTSKNGDDEGGPALTLVSAQAAGLPVICTPFVGSEITVFDGETGIICNQDDSESIAEKMIMLMQNPELGVEIGKNASKLVHKIFLEEVQMKELEKHYLDIINA